MTQVNAKNTKTILFASLIAAMLLPFVVMEGVIAETEDLRAKDNYDPEPETQEQAQRSHEEFQTKLAIDENYKAKNNEIETSTDPKPVRVDKDGKEVPLTPEPGSATDNWFGSKLNKLTSSMDGIYAKNEIHDNVFAVAGGTTLYAPATMPPGTSSLEIVVAYYNPTGSTYDTLDKIFVYDHDTNDWEYEDTIDTSFLNTYTSTTDHIFVEVIE